MTYKRASAHRVNDEPFTITAAFTCDECDRMLSATSVTTAPAAHNRDSHETLISLLRAVPERSLEWQPRTVLGKDFPDIPDHIAAPASEAFECFSIGAHRAAVLLARAVIEASAKDKGVTTGNLNTKIDKLAEQGAIRSLLAEAAHEVRLAGNDMAHGDFATSEITKDDADELLGFMEDFLREMFEIPTRIDRRKAKRNAN